VVRGPLELVVGPQDSGENRRTSVEMRWHIETRPRDDARIHGRRHRAQTGKRVKNRKRIVIVGAGGMAREVASTVQWINRAKVQFDFLGYVVSDLSRLEPRDSRDEVLGDFNWLKENRSSVDALALGIGTPAVRLKLADELNALLKAVEWPVLIHPTAIIDLDSAELGEGCFVGAGVVATVNIRLEPYALVNFGATLGHEAQVGRGSVVNPGANISGGVVIGEGVLVGTGAQILQYLRISSRSIVGAGAVVTKNVASGTTVVGIPAYPRRDARSAAAGR
jgi:sugar O-acyltransferase (sialic acid O-acetyltransferase NeuD family)